MSDLITKYMKQLRDSEDAFARAIIHYRSIKSGADTETAIRDIDVAIANLYKVKQSLVFFMNQPTKKEEPTNVLPTPPPVPTAKPDDKPGT